MKWGFIVQLSAKNKLGGDIVVALPTVKLALALIVLAYVAPGSPQAPSLPSPVASRKAKLFGHHSTIVWSCGSSDVNALVYRAGLAVDADGAFRAYNPDNPWDSIPSNTLAIRATGGPWLLTPGKPAVAPWCSGRGILRPDTTSP